MKYDLSLIGAIIATFLFGVLAVMVSAETIKKWCKFETNVKIACIMASIFTTVLFALSISITGPIIATLLSELLDKIPA